MSAPVIRHGLPPTDDLPHVSVVIVGAGACGLTAALVLQEAGIDCVLLERDALPSGSTALSSGFIPAAGSEVQRAAGIDDSPRRFADDIAGKTRGTAATHLVRAYTEASGPAMDLLARHGLRFEILDGFLYPGHTVRRMHSLPERTGAALMAALDRAVQATDAAVLTRTLVRELWVDEAGRVRAVGGVRPDGSMEYLGCDVLLLACNGFGGNAALRAELLPEMANAVYGGHEGNDGSALLWGRELGAAQADLGGYQGHGSWASPHGVLISWAVIMDGGFQINREGRRFHDETHGYSEAAVHVLAQTDGIAWNVFDGQTLALARTFPDFQDAEAAGALKTCADIDALARVVGCDVTTLRETLDTVSRGATAGDGRTFARAIAAPYYAVKVTGALFHTQGGLDIDAHCRVLTPDGKPFPNLLAAGGAARGVSGNAVWGYLSGNGLLSAVAGGFIAAHTAHTTLDALAAKSSSQETSA
ncbi:FAD-dependent oxidoreductase [Pandoraea fibrosis]|uniref:FAD-dependent oxidoreductase n=1 Tax=Pandoraea fibrosis TaxID=1891094 RepID=A0ABX6HYX9_9BURK|nr:FAD-dependent oxidoreductase [Pandoraea fibrosis]QHE94990.1 FAD-dependent oxidoreductase [Pandoraea fibrosis]QHF15737.1 FAD-dependent oxidoreductase [Pandoraea fibrosis]